MRKTIFTFIFLYFIFSSSSFAQLVCVDLIISEYVEGTGNNKCVEFFNTTSEPIDLSDYELQRCSNGFIAASDETQLVGILPPLSTWVLVNGQTEDVDLGGGSISPACDPDLQQLADQLDNPYPAPTYMNGNDALVLVKNGNVVVDIFGKPGEDPGIAWTDDAENGYVQIEGSNSSWLTSNHTLRRKYEVTNGVVLPPLEFNTFLEWDTLPVNTWGGLGYHSCACGTSKVVDIISDPEASIYPNPSSNGNITVETGFEVELIEIFNSTGQIILVDTPSTETRIWNFDSSAWKLGVYIVNIKYSQGVTYSHRVAVR